MPYAPSGARGIEEVEEEEQYIHWRPDTRTYHDLKVRGSGVIIE
jgi:hypothetical protein